MQDYADVQTVRDNSTGRDASASKPHIRESDEHLNYNALLATRYEFLYRERERDGEPPCRRQVSSLTNISVILFILHGNTYQQDRNFYN